MCEELPGVGVWVYRCGGKEGGNGVMHFCYPPERIKILTRREIGRARGEVVKLFGESKEKGTRISIPRPPTTHTTP